MLRYYTIYKPFQVLSQFTAEGGKECLKDYFSVPEDVYTVGRLDYDSEGLLLLTNDKQVNYRLLHPQFSHEREYYVQVEGAIGKQALEQLSSGVVISIDGKPYRTKPCKAYLLDPAPAVPERNPPIRYRKHVPDSWLRLLLTEGKNRQVRRMTAQVGFPTLRLIRFRIKGLTIEGLGAGDIRELSKSVVYKALFEG